VWLNIGAIAAEVASNLACLRLAVKRQERDCQNDERECFHVILDIWRAAFTLTASALIFVRVTAFNRGIAIRLATVTTF
jgi:hypothetical protein